MDALIRGREYEMKGMSPDIVDDLSRCRTTVATTYHYLSAVQDYGSGYS